MADERFFTASVVKSWFQYRCERKVVYETFSPKQRDSIPIVSIEPPSPWAEFGNEFEDAVISTLRATSSVLSPFPTDKFGLRDAQTEGWLRRELAEQFADQATLKETPALRRLLGIEDQPSVRIKSSRPDLIECVERGSDPVFKLIDIKATQNSTLFHKAQVAFYALALDGMLKQWGTPGTLDPTGEIWHLPPPGSGKPPGIPEKHQFPIAGYVRLVQDFFARQVPQILESEVDARRDTSFFHIYFKCEQCKFLAHCESAIDPKRSAQTWDVSAVAGMSHEAKRSLQRMGVLDVGALARTQSLQGANTSWSLRARGQQFIARAQALVDGTPRRLADRFSWLMPPRVDVAFYLVVDRDPIDGNLATLGLLRSQSEAEPQSTIRLIRSGAEELDAIKCVMGQLVNDLEAIDAHNAAEPDDPIVSHIFLYESSEARDLQATLGRHLEDKEIRSGLLHMLRMFPPEDVVPEPGYRGWHHLPACALKSVVEQLFALPVQVSHDLRRVTAAFGAASPPLLTAYDPAEVFAHRFSSRLSISACRGLQDGSVSAQEVEADVRARLEAMDALARWILEANATAEIDFLRLNKPPFRFQSAVDPLGTGDLDVLLAHELLQDHAGRLSALISLSQPAPQRRDRFDCLAGLKLIKFDKHKWGGGWLLFQVPLESREAEISSESMGLILTDDDPDLRLDPLLWGSLGVSIRPPRPGDRGDTVFVKVYAAAWDSPAFRALLGRNQEGQWFIDKTHVRVNTSRTIDFLRFLSSGGGQ